MLKRFITNTFFSFLSLLLMSVLFTATGFLVLENFKPFARYLVQALFIILMLIGHLIGGKLHFRKSLSVISIVILPVILCAILYLIGFAVPYIGYIVQYPSPVWSEAYGLSADYYMNELDAFRYYAVLIAHYLASALSLFIGAYKKHRENREEELK